MSQHTTYLIGAAIIDALLLAGVVVLVGIVVSRHRERALARAYRAEQRSRRDAPVTHVGATEAYGPELRATGQALPSADLRTTGEQMVADHRELGGISDGLDQFSERVMHELRLFLRDDAEYARVARWAPSSVVDTGTFPVVTAELAGAVA